MTLPEGNRLSVADAASYLQVSLKYMYRLVSEHAIPSYKPRGTYRSGRVRIYEADLEDYLARGRRASSEEMIEAAEAKAKELAL